jgi:hypothetical protein
LCTWHQGHRIRKRPVYHLKNQLLEQKYVNFSIHYRPIFNVLMSLLLEVSKMNNPDNIDIILIPRQQVSELLPSNPPTPWLSPLPSHDSKCDASTEKFDIPESPKYWQDDGSRAGTPFESESPDSDSDSSSDSSSNDSESLSEVAANLPWTDLEPLFSRSVIHFDDWEDIKSSPVRESNSLGLELMPDDPRLVLEAQKAATFNSQVESLRTPPIHQDARSYECPNQKYQEQQEHLVPQFDSPADELLAGRCPQDICIRADVSDASGLKVSGHDREAVPQLVNRAYQRSQGCQRSHVDPESHRPHRDDSVEGLSNAGHLDQSEVAAALDGVSMDAVNGRSCDWELLLRAPRMCPIPLPEDFLHRGPGLVGWLKRALDSVLKTITLSHLDRCV